MHVNTDELRMCATNGCYQHKKEKQNECAELL